MQVKDCDSWVLVLLAKAVRGSMLRCTMMLNPWSESKRWLCLFLQLKQASEDQAAVKDVAEKVWANETELIGMVFDGSGIEQHMEEFYLTALKACVTSTGDMDEECEHL